MQPGIRCQYGSGPQRNGIAVEIGKVTAGFGHDNRQGSNIEDIDVGLDNGFDLARRE